jgi:hypothetical protein
VRGAAPLILDATACGSEQTRQLVEEFAQDKPVGAASTDQAAEG